MSGECLIGSKCLKNNNKNNNKYVSLLYVYLCDNYYPSVRMRERVVVVILSVCLSACLSVTL